MEVMVWPNVLQRTPELWAEGKFVRVTGKLRLRGDQMSLACEQVQEYTNGQPPPANGGDGPGKNGKNGVESNAKPRSSASIRTETETRTSNSASHRTLSLGVTESDNAVEDAHLLREVIGVLLEYPGHDRVNLEIHTGAGRVVLELPVVSTGYCEELKERLSALLGLESVQLHDAQRPQPQEPPR